MSDKELPGAFVDVLYGYQRGGYHELDQSSPAATQLRCIAAHAVNQRMHRRALLEAIAAAKAGTLACQLRDLDAVCETGSEWTPLDTRAKSADGPPWATPGGSGPPPPSRLSRLSAEPDPVEDAFPLAP